MHFCVFVCVVGFISSRAFFYERCFRLFGVSPVVPLMPPAKIADLLKIVIESPSAAWVPEDGKKEDIVDFLVDLLQSKAEMLREYFSIDISPDGYLCGLPQLVCCCCWTREVSARSVAGFHLLAVFPLLSCVQLPHYVPPAKALPHFLFRLAVDVSRNSFLFACFFFLLQCHANRADSDLS